MIVSKLDWQYNYGVNYSSRGAEVFSITTEEFAKIQSGLAEIVDDTVVDIEQPEPAPIEPVDDWFCEVFIPVSIRADETVKAKKADIIDMHTGNIKSTNETRDGIDYQKLYNIHIDKVASFLTSEEYTQFSQAWVLFDTKIKDLFKERIKIPTFYANTSPFSNKINEILELEWSVESTITQNNTEYKMVEFRADYISQLFDQAEYNFFAGESQWCRFSSNITNLFT